MGGGNRILTPWSCSLKERSMRFSVSAEPQELRARKVGNIDLEYDHGQAVVPVFSA